MILHKSYRNLALLLALTAARPLAAQNIPALSQTAPAGSAAPAPAKPVITVNSSELFNYIRTFTPQVPVTNAATLTTATPPATAMTATTYLDGFNRAMQSVMHNFTTGKSLVQAIDSRPMPYAISYPAYPATGYGFREDAFNEQGSYYLGRYAGEGSTAYGRSVNGSTASVRSDSAYAPGKSQAGQYRGTVTRRIANDVNQVRLWTAAAGGPTTTGFYAINELAGEEVTDAGGGRTRTFSDKDGHVVYKSVLLEGSTEAVTQYVYNDMGQLCFVLPPAASQTVPASGAFSPITTVLDNLCFQYQYDGKGRLKASHKPGEKGFTEIVYDRKDRVVLRRSPLETALGKWEVTFYDKQGRVIATSLYGSASAQATWQNLIDATAPGTAFDNTKLIHYLATDGGEGQYPATITGNVVMSYNFYDHYGYSAIAPVFGDAFTAAYFTESPAGAEASTRQNLTTGLLTGSRVRVIKDSGTGAELGDWIETVNYYDRKGRLIQQRIRNHTKNASNVAGKEYVCNYYDFKDRLLLSSHGHENKKTLHAATEHTRYSYDEATGRLTETGHRVNEDSWKTLSRYEYDELGQVSRKVLGNYGEVQDYGYNIRGQLTGINGTYAETGNKEGQRRSFGASLRYDYGFTDLRYDGKPAGLVWRGSSGSMMAYGYGYDLAGRLKKADYRKWEVNAAYPMGTWSNTWSDYSVSNLGYDRNGNMTTMTQRGMGLVGSSIVPVTMDHLSYTYESQSNRLARVEDTVATNYNLGDFINGNVNSPDYSYDASGNLGKDRNKGIDTIVYTWFNKPHTITFSNGSSIKYIYDAAGSKLQEIATSGGVAKKTDYVGNFVYQNDTLKYLGTAEGRTVYTTADGSYKEEFFVRDHLGNVRSTVDVYTYPVSSYLASYEVASAHLEGLVFDKVSEIAEDNPDSPDPGNMQSGKLNGGDASRRVGTSLLVKVMTGDRVEINVNSYYQGYSPGADAPVNASTMLSSIVSTLTSGTGGLGGSESHNPQLVGSLFNSNNYTQFNNIINSSTDPAKPKAYLNYILFNQQMQIVGSFAAAFQANGLGTWGEIGTTEPLEIPQNGYLAVYLTCGSTHDVFFDQLMVRLTKANLLEENHYYPHGLPMGNIGSTAMGFSPNRLKHQSNEYIKDAGLNWMDFSFRQYDPQIGRFLSVDPLAAGTDMLSSFAAMNNQPESMVDPLGLQSFYATYAGFTNRIDDPSGFGAGRMRRPYNGPGPEREAMLAGSIAGTGYGWYVLEMAAKREREEGLKAMRQRELTLMGMRDVYAANLAGNFDGRSSMVWYDGDGDGKPGEKGALGKLDDWIEGGVGSSLSNFGTWMRDRSWFGKLEDYGDKHWKQKYGDKYMGADGFRNYGWPTMQLTAGVLGTALSAGVFGVYVASAGVSTGGVIWGASTLTLGAYSTVNDGVQMVNGGSLPLNKPIGYINSGVDAYDLFSSGSPIGAINIGLKMMDYYIQKQNRKK